MADGSVMGKYFPLNYSSLPKNENLRSNYRLPQQTADIVNVSQILITIKKPKRYVAKQINKKRRQLSSQKQPVPTAKRAWYISAQIEQVPGVGMWHNLVQRRSNLVRKWRKSCNTDQYFGAGKKSVHRITPNWATSVLLAFFDHWIFRHRDYIAHDTNQKQGELHNYY